MERRGIITDKTCAGAAGDESQLAFAMGMALTAWPLHGAIAAVRTNFFYLTGPREQAKRLAIQGVDLFSFHRIGMAEGWGWLSSELLLHLDSFFF